MRKLLVAAAVAAAVIPALALAAEPKKNSSFSWCPTKNSCPLVFETTKTGKKIKDLRMYNDCARVPVEGGYPKIRVKGTGKFKKSGTVTDVIGQELAYTIKGRFKRPKKAVGTYEIDASRNGKPKCDSEPQKFVAKRVGKAQPGV